MHLFRGMIGAIAAVAAAVVALPDARAGGEGTAATPWLEVHSARVRLVGGADARRPGKSYLAGIEITMADGWKTYWRNPGEAGIPPYFDWADSTNAKTIAVRYPAPVRVSDPAAEMIGYKKTVVFPVEVTPASLSEPVDLRLALEFAVCREICIPAQAALDLRLTPQLLQGAPVPSVAAALDEVPRSGTERRSGDPQLRGATANLGGTSPNLQVEAHFPGGPEKADLFIEAPDGIFVPMARKLPGGTGGTVRFSVDLSRGGNASELKGKELTLTLVGNGGAAEAVWKVE